MTELHVQEGQSVEAGALLAVVGPVSRVSPLQAPRDHGSFDIVGIGLAIVVGDPRRRPSSSRCGSISGPRCAGWPSDRRTGYCKRPIHIGGLSVRVLRGRFELDDFSIEGLKPTDRPFFSAKQLSMSLDWCEALRRASPSSSSHRSR